VGTKKIYSNMPKAQSKKKAQPNALADDYREITVALAG
jgi:hypothetical protein